MSRAGNQNIKGQVQVEVIRGPSVQFVPGTNSGLFASIDYNGVGDYTVNVNPQTPITLNASSVPDTQLEGTAAGICVSQLATGTTIEIRVFNNAGPPVPDDLPFALRVKERFFG